MKRPSKGRVCIVSLIALIQFCSSMKVEMERNCIKRKDCTCTSWSEDACTPVALKEMICQWTKVDPIEWVEHKWRSLEHLRLLDVTFAVDHLPKLFFSGFHNLRRLWIWKSKLRTMEPGAFEKNTKLTFIWLMNNDFVTISNDYFQGKSMQGIFMDMNPRLHLQPNSLNKLEVRQLGFSYCNLTEVNPYVFKTMRDSWPRDYYASLDLDLSGNHLAVVPDGIFFSISYYTTVHMYDTPLKCVPRNCWLKWGGKRLFKAEHSYPGDIFSPECTVCDGGSISAADDTKIAIDWDWRASG